MKRATRRKDAPVRRSASGPARDVDEYLARLPGETRAALEKLRRIIRSAAPDATEVISYRIPTFRHLGGLVAFGATASHCSFYVMSTGVMEAHRDLLEGYDTAKGTVHFAADRPLPAPLVRRLVKARLAENAARGTR